MVIRNLNLMWEERVRGSFPVSPYSLEDTGCLTRALPRPLEARVYDLTRIDAAGKQTSISSFSSQTLLELKVSAEADSCVGVTASEVYLFRKDGKERLMPERRLAFVDAAISADGQRVAVGFSDMAGASFAVALAEIGGRVGWVHDVEGVLTCLAFTRNGDALVFGTEAGHIEMLDVRMRSQWRFEQEELVRALSTSQNGRRVFYGTAAGTLACIENDGARVWDTRLPAEIVSIVASADGATVAAVCAGGEEGGSRLFCLTETGKIGYEQAFEKRITGIALSPSGDYLAMSMRDGMAQVYEAVRGELIESAMGMERGDPIGDADRFVGVGDLAGAYMLLRDASERDPANLVLHTALVQRYQEWLKGSIAIAQAQYESKDFEGATRTLEAMREVDGRNPTVISLLNQARLERAKQVWQQATGAAVKGDMEAASEAFLEAIRLQPLAPEPRTQLAQLYAKRAANADSEAETHKAQGDWTGAILVMERAQSLQPTPERAIRILQAQRDSEFEQGMAFYNAKQYPQAIFQFQKVLGQNPNHAEAKRHLQYAQRLAQDTNSDLLQDRFSRLE